MLFLRGTERLIFGLCVMQVSNLPSETTRRGKNGFVDQVEVVDDYAEFDTLRGKRIIVSEEPRDPVTNLPTGGRVVIEEKNGNRTILGVMPNRMQLKKIEGKDVRFRHRLT